jgi:GNAT superfamily N-acetyltransferase
MMKTPTAFFERIETAQSLPMMNQVMTHRLTAGNQAEVLSFLSERPLHTTVMTGLISDNGIESTLNRGCFYGCRGPSGNLEGVALIGHAILMETGSDEALAEFARVAQTLERSRMIMGEHDMIRRFWEFYCYAGQPLRHRCTEVLWELNESPPNLASLPELRRAKLDDLWLISPIHAALAMQESGINPLDADRHGFEMRCRRRIGQERVWVVTEGREVIFKADVISESPNTIYVEGVYVHPERRGRGYGSRCMAEMSRHFLRRSKSITVLVNEERHAAQRFFRKLGFISRATYDTIFLQERTPT